MEGNKNYSPNSRLYESHLSLFGRNVLDNLTKKWLEDRNRARARIASSHHPRMPPPYRPQPQTKKVLTFLSEETRALPLPVPSVSPIPCVEIPNENDDYDQLLNFDAGHKVFPPTPTANELFKTVASIGNKTKKDARFKPTSTIKAISNFSHCDEVNATNYRLINLHIDVNETGTSNNRFDNTENENNCGTTNKDGDLGPGLQVNWDDMFGTELLPVATNAKFMIQENTITNTADETFNRANRDEYSCDNFEKKQDIKTKTKETKQTDALKLKRKAQSKVTEELPKKVKKTNETEKPKYVLRKEKYTKTVKNWLDNVDPNNLVENDEVTKPNSDEKTIIEKNTISSVRKRKESNIIIDKVMQKSKKKEIQAQLANKDGKMKFGKPKVKTESKITPNTTEYDKSDILIEKKSKPKFVAPIKSQVPVKDVDYNVITVNSANIKDITTTLLSILEKDITLVLMYSNGFSQLNQHHTKDSCEPEGLLVNIGEQLLFYYFKGVHQDFKIALESLLNNNSIICYEGKSLLIYLKYKFGFDFRDLSMIDAKIGGSLLDPDSPPETFSELQKLLSYTPQYTVATECVLQRSAWYTVLLDECAVRLTTNLKENGLWTVFVEVEMKLVPIIAEMEHRGVAVDLPKLKSMEDILLLKMKEIEQECYKTAGKTFQINSAVQVRSILYEELQLDTKCNVKVRDTLCQGAKSTSEAMLRSLASEHPLPRLILEYRHLHKVHATFLTGIAHHVKDGVVRPTWVQTAAATGRIASNNPNLQAIPKTPFSLLLFPDKSNSSGGPTLRMRAVYCARAGHTLLAADFRHVECRVLAHCAADRALLAALGAGADLFRTLAATWLSRPESAVTAEQRERAKRLVYASLYGAGAAKLADILGATYEHTLNMMATFNSSAADLCKTAMVLTASSLRAHRPPLDAGLLLQIHDELVWELRDDQFHTAAGIIKRAMESCGQHCGMPGPLPVALSAGRTWGDLADYSPPTEYFS